MKFMLNHSKINQQLAKYNATESLSFSHGLLCGYAIVKPSIQLRDWLNEICDRQNDQNQDETVLLEVFNKTLESLKSNDLSFELLINDVNAEPQLNSVIDWCNGFLSGLGLVKINLHNSDVEEVMQTMTIISQIDNNINGSQEDEVNIMEIIEFIRVGVLLIQETVNPYKINFIDSQK